MILGRYEVLGLIGSGGFGRVMLARDPAQTDPAQTMVAIKRLKRTKARRKGVRAAIENEARIGLLLRHPNIVRVLELTHVGADILLVMEFVNGIGLDEALGRRFRALQPLPPRLAVQIAIQAARGLHAAHEARDTDGSPLNIVHRDIKPSNIMVAREGLVRVMDFGVARAASSQVQTTTGTIKGTLRYLSPEQAQGSREVGPAADQFALGLVLGEMLLGRPVYEGEKDHHVLLKALKGQLGTAVEEANALLPGIGAILHKALAFPVDMRFPSMGDLAEALEASFEMPDAEAQLAEWVHGGMEARARLAEEDGESWSHTAEPSEVSELRVSIMGRSMPLELEAPSGSHILGWAAEHLAAAELSDDRLMAEAGLDEEDLEDEDADAPVISVIDESDAIEVLGVADAEGWAMVQDRELEEQEGEEEPLFPGLGARGREDGSPPSRTVRLETDPVPEPSSATSYAKRRAGKERVPRNARPLPGHQGPVEGSVAATDTSGPRDVTGPEDDSGTLEVPLVSSGPYSSGELTARTAGPFRSGEQLAPITAQPSTDELEFPAEAASPGPLPPSARRTSLESDEHLPTPKPPTVKRPQVTSQPADGWAMADSDAPEPVVGLRALLRRFVGNRR